MLANVAYRMISIPRIKSRDQLWNQMGMLACFLHSRKTWTRSLPLPRAGRDIPILQNILLPNIPLRLLFQQPQIQLSQRIRAKSSAVERRVIADDADALQLLGDAVEDGVGIDAFGAQGLEE